MAVAASVVERADVVAGEVVGVHPGAGDDGPGGRADRHAEADDLLPRFDVPGGDLVAQLDGLGDGQVAAVGAYDVARPQWPGGDVDVVALGQAQQARRPTHRSTPWLVPGSMSTIAFTRSPVPAASSGRSSLTAASDNRRPIHGSASSVAPATRSSTVAHSDASALREARTSSSRRWNSGLSKVIGPVVWPTRMSLPPGPTSSKAASMEAFEPVASNTSVGRSPSRCPRRVSCRSGPAATVASPMVCSAKARLPGDRSLTTTRSTASRMHWATARPIGPVPTISTVSEGTGPARSTACMPIPRVSTSASWSSDSPGRGYSAETGTTRRSRMPPSTVTPSTSMRSQQFAWPLAQAGHAPQERYGITAQVSPTQTAPDPLADPPAVPGPSSSTSTASSCPRTLG